MGSEIVELEVRTLQRLLEAFNAHDIDLVMSFFADDCVMEMPRGPNPWGLRLEGRERVREGVASRFAGIPDVHYGEDRHWVCGDRGCSEWLLTEECRLARTRAGEEVPMTARTPGYKDAADGRHGTGPPAYDITAYLNWMLDYGLALVVDDRGRLWRFRHASPGEHRGPDARLEGGELVITERVRDEREAVTVRLEDNGLDLCCQNGVAASHDRVALPPGVAFDQVHMTTARHDGVFDVHLPLVQPDPSVSGGTVERFAA